MVAQSGPFRSHFGLEEEAPAYHLLLAVCLHPGTFCPELNLQLMTMATASYRQQYTFYVYTSM